jgi:uncharacterized protein YjiS (DUF1127 family)
MTARAPRRVKVTPFARSAVQARRFWVAVSAYIGEWRCRARSRRELLMLDDRELSDAGITRMEAIAEGTKPFWRK